MRGESHRVSGHLHAQFSDWLTDCEIDNRVANFNQSLGTSRSEGYMPKTIRELILLFGWWFLASEKLRKVIEIPLSKHLREVLRQRMWGKGLFGYKSGN